MAPAPSMAALAWGACSSTQQILWRAQQEDGRDRRKRPFQRLLQTVTDDGTPPILEPIYAFFYVCICSPRGPAGHELGAVIICTISVAQVAILPAQTFVGKHRFVCCLLENLTACLHWRLLCRCCSERTMDSPFGHSTLFGQPSNDPNMNVYYMQQAQLFFRQKPGNVQASRQLAYWTGIVQRQAAAAAATAAAMAAQQQAHAPGLAFTGAAPAQPLAPMTSAQSAGLNSNLYGSNIAAPNH